MTSIVPFLPLIRVNGGVQADEDFDQLSLTFTETDGATPVSLGGLSFTSKIGSFATASTTAGTIVISGSGSNVLSFDIPAAAKAAWPQGTWPLTLQATDGVLTQDIFAQNSSILVGGSASWTAMTVRTTEVLVQQTLVAEENDLPATGGNTITLTADTAIAAGTSASVNSVGHAVQTWGPAPAIANTATLLTNDPPVYQSSMILPLSASQFVAFQTTQPATPSLPFLGSGAVAFSVTGLAISVGTPNTGGGLQNAMASAALSGGLFVYTWFDLSGNLNIQAVSIAVNAMTLGASVQAAASVSGNLVNPVRIHVVALSATSFFLVYADSNNQATYVVGTVSGTTITLGTPVVTSLPTDSSISLLPIAMSATQVVLAWLDDSTSVVTAMVVTVIGTTPTPHATATVSGAISQNEGGIFGIKIDATHFCITYGGNLAASDYASYAAIGSIATNAITFGANTKVLPWWAALPSYVIALSSGELVFYGGGTTPTIASLSGTTLTPTFGVAIPVLASPPQQTSAVQFNANPFAGTTISNLVGSASWVFPPIVGVGTTNYLWEDGLWNIYQSTTAGAQSVPIQHPGVISYAFAPINTTTALAIIQDNSATLYARAITINAINSPPIGCVASAVTSGNPATITLSGACAGFSGLAPGSEYYANGDGTLTTANTGHPMGVGLSASSLLVSVR